MLLFSVLALALAESHCAGTASERAEGRDVLYLPRRSSPEEGISSSGVGDGDSLVPIPFPCAVSGEYGSVPSHEGFGAKPRQLWFESMVNLGFVSDEQVSASDLMARDLTEGSVSRQTLVGRDEGTSPTHFVSRPPSAGS